MSILQKTFLWVGTFAIAYGGAQVYNAGMHVDYLIAIILYCGSGLLIIYLVLRHLTK